jgi:hypothetical protein
MRSNLGQFREPNPRIGIKFHARARVEAKDQEVNKQEHRWSFYTVRIEDDS